MNAFKIFTAIAVIIIFINPIPAQQKKKQTMASPIEVADEPAVILGGMKISLGQAIRQAIEKNHDILSGSYDVAMTDSLYQKYQKKYSIFMSADAGVKYEKYTDSMSMLYGEDKKSLDAIVSVAKMFSSGTTIAAGIKHEYAKKTVNPMALPVYDNGTYVGSTPPLSFSPDEYHMPILFFSVQQELLKNAFGYSERRMEKILKNAGKMKRDAILFQLSMVIVGVIVDYWTVVIDKTSVENADLQLRETKKVRNIMARNVRMGLYDNFNLNYYNALFAGSEASLSSAKQKYRNSLRNFLTTINLNENMKIEGTAIFSDKLPEVNIEEALKLAYKKRADYKNARLYYKNVRLELELYSNHALPSLTAQLNMRTMGETNDLPQAYSDTVTATYPSIEARVKMTYPLDDREQKINERNARFKLKQAKINLDKYKRVVKDDVVSKVEQINTSYEIYQKAKEARKQSGLFYRKMLVNMRRGRLSAAMVKNGLDALIKSRQGELESLVYFNVSLLQFEVAKNELFEKYEIDVDKYIPKNP